MRRHYDPLAPPRFMPQVWRTSAIVLSLAAPATPQSPSADATLGGSASLIIIATGKNAKYELTSPADGVMFDIDGDGNLEQISWTPPDSPIAFLAIDRNNDGQITSGKELFGNFTVSGSPNGFDALQKMAMESNGGVERHSVSADDPVFDRLLLWTDHHHNGISELSELRPASELLSDIGLGYQIRKQSDQHGNQFRYRGWVHIRTKPGRDKVNSAEENNERTRHIWDVYLKRFVASGPPRNARPQRIAAGLSLLF